MPFLKSELRRLAEFGARRELAQMEYTIHTYQREFPDLFVSDERVILLKAELRSNANGTYPSAKRSLAARAAWTPARRAEAALRLREMKAGGLMQGRKKKKAAAAKTKAKAKTTTKKAKSKPSPSKKKGEPTLKDRWYDRLLSHGPEMVGISAKALGNRLSASLLTSGEDYIKRGVIKKIGKGVYGVGEAARS